MGSRIAEQPPHAAPIPVYITPPLDNGDDFTLAGLWLVVASHRLILLLSLLVALVGAIGYLYLAQPVYKATAHLLPPQLKDIQGLLIDYGGMENYDPDRYTPESVYRAFIAYLRSQGVRREFFDTHDLAKYYRSETDGKDVNLDRIFDAMFSSNLQVQVDRNDPLFVSVSFSDTNPEHAAMWLNELIKFANAYTLKQLTNDVRAAILTEVGRIRYQLSSKLKLAELRRYDKTVVLREALQVARTLGINDSHAFPASIDKSNAAVSVNTVDVPLYMRGTHALETEITVLESRKTDEPFIDGYRDLQEKLGFLENVTLDPDDMSAVTVDSSAKAPYREESPNTALVIIMALLLGASAGIMLALIVDLRLKKPGVFARQSA